MRAYEVVASSATKCEFRPCDVCALPTELIFASLSSEQEEPFLAWRCGECGGILAEDAWRPFVATFIDDATPSVECPTCHGFQVTGDISRDSNSLHCVGCGARLRVAIEQTDGT